VCVTGCVPDINNLCNPWDGGWCRFGECASSDSLGCYNAFTEMGHLFEYELWGCTEYATFTSKLKSPSGIALSPDGLVVIADYDSGDIVAFSKLGTEVSRVSTGSPGVTGLHLRCAGSQPNACTLWYTNSGTWASAPRAFLSPTASC
jgi:hypothetical protein